MHFKGGSVSAEVLAVSRMMLMERKALPATVEEVVEEAVYAMHSKGVNVNVGIPVDFLMMGVLLVVLSVEEEGVDIQVVAAVVPPELVTHFSVVNAKEEILADFLMKKLVDSAEGEEDILVEDSLLVVADQTVEVLVFAMHSKEVNATVEIVADFLMEQLRVEMLAMVAVILMVHLPDVLPELVTHFSVENVIEVTRADSLMKKAVLLPFPQHLVVLVFAMLSNVVNALVAMDANSLTMPVHQSKQLDTLLDIKSN